MKNVLVTGGSGFFGSWLVPKLASAGYNVDVYDLKNNDDIFDEPKLRKRLKNHQSCVHLAAIPHYDPNINPADYARTNVYATMKLAEACKKAKLKSFVFTSSGAIYGFSRKHPPGWVKPPITEDKPESWADLNWKDSLNNYSVSKILCEEYLRQLTGLTVTALRINCIEPRMFDVHWGWMCTQATATKAFIAAIQRVKGRFEAVNVGEPHPNLDATRLKSLMDLKDESDG